MGEVLNVIVAFAVIVFAVRWATKGQLCAQSLLFACPDTFLRQGTTKCPWCSIGIPPKACH